MGGTETEGERKAALNGRTTYGNHCAAIRVGVPGLLVDLQGALGHQQPNEGRHFRG